jgi:ADP-ribose pyrophosphatase YjhB (NUDIX family)
VDGAALLEELRSIAYEGLSYAESPYDRERYERLAAIVGECYEALTGIRAAETSERFRRELGTPTPKIGVTAVIPDDQGRLLLQRRADDGLWGLPGGWLGVNETPEAGVVREVREETGLEVDVVRLGAVTSRPASLPASPHGAVGICYLCRSRGGRVTPDHESLELAWLDPAEVSGWHAEHGERVARTLDLGARDSRQLGYRPAS